MLRLLRSSPFGLLIGHARSCRTDLCLLHGAAPETLINPSVSDTTASYLVESCGLSPAAALNVAKKFKLRTTGRADSFLSLLSARGFTQSQIAFIVASNPGLLTFDQEKCIIPKLDFFVNVGFSSAELVKTISRGPHILKCSLEKRLSRNFNMLSAVLGSDRKAINFIGKEPRIIASRLDCVVLPNMKTLSDIGVPLKNIVRMLTFFPRRLMESPYIFNKHIDWLKKMGFDVSQPGFIQGLNAVSALSSSTWEKKLEFYRSLGWSEETVLTVFRKYPHCMTFSEEKVLKIMSFFIKEMKCKPCYISARPFLLYHSFEKRIAPRYKIFCLLESNRLIRMELSFVTVLSLTHKDFKDKYVTKYVCQIPDLLKFYKNK